MIDLFVRICVAFSLIGIKTYWSLAESKAYAHLPPKIERRRHFMRKVRFIEYIFYAVIIAQFLGVSLLPFQPSWTSRVIGLMLFLYGFILSIQGRKTLGTNWTHMIDYQVKEHQKLITHGIYQYVRHPIYAGAMLIIAGVQILLTSWLWLPLSIVISFLFYLQSKKEESILARHFGKEYLRYMHNTKMFFPYLF